MFEPLYTAEEMKRGRGRPDVDELMARAGRAVAEEARRRFPDARASSRSAARGERRRRADRARGARVGRRSRAGRRRADRDTDVIVDALFGTGFQGEPREDAASQIEQINAAGVPVVSVDLPSGVDASTGEVAGACVQAT